MTQLSSQDFERARTYLATHGRPVEAAWFRHAFESAPAQDVARALAEYQNADGGFGHALESDVRTSSSSALATSIGLGILRDVGMGADAPQVQRAVRYLVETLDPEEHVWRIVPTNTNSSPHAPWWHDQNGSLAEGFGKYRVNPRADLVGLLYTYASLIPEPWLADLTERTVSDIEARDLDAHELICAMRLVETAALPEHFRSRLAPRVTEQVLRTVSRNADEWKDYTPQPLWYASTPRALVAETLRDALQANLDFLIEQQTEVGSWEPSWSWGDVYPEAWEQAKRDASSALTLKALLQLRAFGRVEGI
jgi:hypothetical protein